MLCDLPGVLSFLGLPPETEMPPGNKGKTKLKKLYRKVAPNKAYHSGERAKDLISHLDMAEIRASAPVQELGCSSFNTSSGLFSSRLGTHGRTKTICVW